MGLFGKKSGLFGAPMMGETPMTAGSASASPAAATLAPSTATPFKGKRNFLDKLGLVADAFGNNHNNADQLADRDRQEFLQLQFQQKPDQEFAGWRRQYDYQVANPKPQGPTELSQRITELNTYRPGLGDTYAQNYAQNGGGMPQITNIPGVGMVSIPRSPVAGMGGAPSQVPDGAVSMLKQNPGMAAQFDAKYGAGASARYLGGAAPGAGSPFPIR